MRRSLAQPLEVIIYRAGELVLDAAIAGLVLLAGADDDVAS